MLNIKTLLGIHLGNATNDDLLPEAAVRRATKRARPRAKRLVGGLALILALALVATTCGDDDDSSSGSDGSSGDSSSGDGSSGTNSSEGDGSSSDGTADSIVVYSGRSEDLMSPLFEAFTEATGVEVDIRYAGSPELALLIDTEGDASPADVFISQSPGALGYLAGTNRLIGLSDATLNRVSDGLRASDGSWVGITGRVRTLVYNSGLVDEAELPSSILDLTDPVYKGRVAVAPANSSFQDFVTAMRNELGDQATGDWLAGMGANEAPNYPKNSAIVEAVGRGEVDMGLVNHYYNLRALEADPSVLSVNHFFPADDLGSLVIVTGGAVLDTSDAPVTAEALLAFLLEDEQQSTFASETQEYPLVAGMDGPPGLPALNALTVDTIDFDLLGDRLVGTQELIRNSGIER